MADTATVEVYNPVVPEWVTLSVDYVQLTRKISTHGAIFKVSDAQVADRILLIQGRNIKIKLDQGGTEIHFKGYVEKPKVIVDNPGTFNLLISCVGLEHGATFLPTVWEGRKTYSSTEAYTAILIDLWTRRLPAMNRTKVVTNAKTLPANEEWTFQYQSLAQMTNDVIARLDNYVWWIEWDGTTEYLRVEPRAHNDPSISLDQDDIMASFEMEPRVTDLRNFVRVVGGQGGGPDPEGGGPSEFFPVSGIAQDTDSQTRYGTRPLVIVDLGGETDDQCVDRAEGELAKHAWATWSGKFRIYNFVLQPNDKVTFQIVSIGQEGVLFGDEFLVEKTVDVYERGKIIRDVTLTEIVPTSIFVP